MWHTNKGFTLLELLVVILMIGILSAIAVPQYRRAVERSKVGEALTMLRAISDSCERFAWEHQWDTCQQAVNSNVESRKVRFRKLDIIAKGTYSNDGMKLTTKNFVYALPSNGSSAITATIQTGTYKDKQIVLTGRTFSCVPTGGCAGLGEETWNK